MDTSTQARTPDSGMSSSSTGEFFAIITQLIAEKDRLVMEKDELVVSKDRLWREMYQMNQEKGERVGTKSDQRSSNRHLEQVHMENRQLRAENVKLRQRSRELEQALKDALETDEDHEDESIEEDDLILSQDNFDQVQGEPLYELGNGTMQDTSIHRQLHTPTSQDFSLHHAERFSVNCDPPVVVKVRPVIKSSSFTEHTYGLTTDLTPAMSGAVMEVLEKLGSLPRFLPVSLDGARGCTERILGTHDTYWTLEDPGCCACKTCFNRKKPCMRSLGNHQWIVLPLPPGMRDTGVGWQDKAYYIYPHEGNSARYPGIWRVVPNKSRTMRREQMAAAKQEPLAESSYEA